MTDIGNTKVGIITCTDRLYCVKCERVPIVPLNSGLLDLDPPGRSIYGRSVLSKTPCCGCGKPIIKGWFDDFADRVLDKATRLDDRMAKQARTMVTETQEAVDRILKG